MNKVSHRLSSTKEFYFISNWLIYVVVNNNLAKLDDGLAGTVMA
jgi:hypothetical protein